jgi:hypothetical protein
VAQAGDGTEVKVRIDESDDSFRDAARQSGVSRTRNSAGGLLAYFFCATTPVGVTSAMSPYSMNK